MSLIRSKDTVPELRMKKLLRSANIRYRRHVRLVGTPDFLLNGKVALFVNGEFWHGKDFEDWKHKLSPWWRNKIATNRRRDKRVTRALRRQGYRVVNCWEKDVKRRPESCIRKIKRSIHGLLRGDR